MSRHQTRRTTTKASPSPSDLIDNELAYSFVSDSLFIKNPVTGEVDVVGGKSYTQALSTSTVRSINGQTGVVEITAQDVPGSVRSVNGTSPDISGNVTVETTSSVTSSQISDATAVGRSMLTAPTADAQRQALGLGSAALQSSSSFASAAQGAAADTALQVQDADDRYVRTVNGTAPDASGNVSVSGGSGSTSFAGITGAPADNTALSSALSSKVDKAVSGATVTVSGNMSASHLGKVITVDTSSAAVVLTLVPGVISTASDRITYKRRGGNSLTFVAANGATLNDPHLMQIVDGDLAVIAGTAIDTATVVGMPGDMVRKTRANLYTARQAIAPVTLSVSGGVIPMDASLSNNFVVSLTESATLQNPTTLIGGQAGTIDVINTGSFSLSFGPLWRPVVGATTAVKQGAGGFSMVTFKVSADSSRILYNIIQEQ